MRFIARFTVLASLLLAACTSPELPAVDDAPSPIPASARWLWYDATANFERLGTPEGVRRVVALTDSIGFTDVVLDLKPISGDVLYDSEHAPRLRTWEGFTRPDTFDFVGLTMAEARQRGLRVHLALNVFAEGHHDHDAGRLYTDHPEWQTHLLTADGTIRPTTEVKAGYSGFVNPASPVSRAHALAVIGEMARRFRPDGLILDRARYDNLYSDFSDESRALFEQWSGKAVAQWPGDIMTRTSDPATPTRGPRFNEWLEWRAHVIKTFFEAARDTVKAASPETRFGVYVGAWYPVYYELGVNWASPRYDPSQDFDRSTPTYQNQAYTQTLDFLLAGNYYVEVDPAQLRETNEKRRLDNALSTQRDSTYNVESSVRQMDRLLMDDVPWWPSLYVEQYRDAGHPERFETALRKILEMTNGVMLFDLVHIEQQGLWDVVAQAFRDYPPVAP